MTKFPDLLVVILATSLLSCSAQNPERPTSGRCEPWRPSDPTVWVSPEVLERLPDAHDVLEAWQTLPANRENAGTHIVMGPPTQVASWMTLSATGPLRISLGKNASLSGLSHEICHIAWRSPCHAEEGICSRRTIEGMSIYPTEKELALWRVYAD